MRIALVSPYSWSHPGGVTRHIEALAAELTAAGHEPRVIAPFDGEPGSAPENLVSLGPTLGWSFNGAKSNIANTPLAAATLRRELRTGDYDVVHLHEPVAPLTGWMTPALALAPVVATYHTYSHHLLPHAVAWLWGASRNMNRLRVRIAVSEAAEWTGRRFFGGEYRIVPNGVTLPEGGAPPPRPRVPGEPLEIAFVGQAVERKGLPVLLRAFEALREQVPARLSVIGVEADALSPLLADPRGVTALGRVDDEEKRAALTRAHVLCAPSLGGESFGMVLTEAFAAGTPVVASDIAGYRGVVEDGADGVLVPPGDALALAETLHDLALDPARLERLGERAGRSAEQYAWPRVTEQVLEAYDDAIAIPEPETADRPRRGPHRAALRRRRPAPPRAPAAVAGAARQQGRARRQGRAPGRPRRRRLRRHRRRLLRHPAHRLELGRGVRARLQPRLGAARDRADVRLDGAARRLLARDPARRAARLAPALHRRAPGHLDRGADVRHAAGPPRRALARPDRRAPARAPA